MSNMAILEKRLKLLGITEDTKHNIGLFYPHFQDAIDGILGKFYSRMLSLPEGRKILVDQDTVYRLKPLQKTHWLQLFSCTFDEDYVSGALRVGQVHYEQNVAPYLYMAGYNFVHCELIDVASQNFTREMGLSTLLSSLTRVITLDMDLALSAYTREHWRQVPGAA